LSFGLLAVVLYVDFGLDLSAWSVAAVGSWVEDILVKVEFAIRLSNTLVGEVLDQTRLVEQVTIACALVNFGITC